MRSLLDNPGQHLADASSQTIDIDILLVDEPDLTVEEVGRLLDDENTSQGQSEDSTFLTTNEVSHHYTDSLGSPMASSDSEDGSGFETEDTGEDESEVEVEIEDENEVAVRRRR